MQYLNTFFDLLAKSHDLIQVFALFFMVIGLLVSLKFWKPFFVTALAGIAAYFAVKGDKK